MSWIEDQTEKHKFARDYGTFIGGFSNPEAANKMRKHDEPDYESDDEAFEKSIERVVKDRDKVINWDKSENKENSNNTSKLRHISKRKRKRVIK